MTRIQNDESIVYKSCVHDNYSVCILPIKASEQVYLKQ